MTTLLDRGTAQQAVTRLVDALAVGSGGALFLVGKAGLGKSSLLAQARDGDGQVRVVHGPAGRAGESTHPYALLAQVVAALEGPGRSGLPLDESAVWAQLQQCLAAAASRAPLLLLLDDLHWADPDSLAVLAQVVREGRDLRVGVVGAMRDWPAGAVETARRLVVDGRADLVELEPLRREAAGTLLATLVGTSVPTQVRDRAWQLSEGNPYLLGQLAQTVRSEGTLPDPAGFDLGWFRRVLLLSALTSLPTAAVEYVRAAAVLGTDFRLALVPAVAGFHEHEAAAAVDVLVRAGVLTETRRGWAAFAHALVGHAVYDDTTPGHRSQLHRRAYELLLQLGEVPAAAHHAVCADLVGDTEAVEAVRAAARLSSSCGAVLTAVQQLDAAVELCGGPAPGSLQLQRADALLAAGRPAEAAAACQLALEDASLTHAERGAGWRLRARALAYAGDLVGAARVGGGAVELAWLGAGEDLSEPGLAAVADALVEHVHAVWQSEGAAAAWALLEEAPRVTPQLLAARSFVGYFAHADSSALQDLAAVLPDPGAGRTAADQASPFDPMLTYMTVARLCERFDEHDRVLATARAAAAASGLVHAEVALEISCFDGLLRRGRLREAAELLVALERAAGVEPLMAEVIGLARTGLLCERGHPAAAAEVLATTDASPSMWMSRLSRAHLQGLVLLEDERVADPEPASDAYRRTEELADRLGIADPCQVMWAGAAVEAHVRAGRLIDADRVCRHVEALVPRLSATWPRMVAWAGRARLAAARGEQDEADSAYDRAICLRVPLPVERTRILLAQGSWLRRSNRPLAARSPLAEALATAAAIGADGLVTRAAAELRVAGGRRRVERDPGSLTPQQLRIARLAAEGWTNREVAQRLSVTVKTVETHLTQVYRALDLGGRRELRSHPAIRTPDPTAAEQQLA